jgi:hypothetical protein
LKASGSRRRFAALPPRTPLKVLFLDKPEILMHAMDVGEGLAEPVDVGEIVAAADRLLAV